MTAVPSIEDLSRAELVELIKGSAMQFEARDIAMARWIVASDAYSKAAERIEPLQAAHDTAWEARIANPSSLKARKAFDKTDIAFMTAQRVKRAAWSRRWRLYDEWCALDKTEDAA
jgi:hypothetical protein